MFRDCPRTVLRCLILALAVTVAHASAPAPTPEPAPSPAAAADPGNVDTAPAAEPVELTPLVARFSASMDKGIALKGSAVRTLKLQDDGTWMLSFDVDSLIADITESLRFRWQDGQVIPLSYRYKLSGFMLRNRERSLNYDWDRKMVTGHYEGETISMSLPEDALDPLGYQLQLRQDLKAGKTRVEYLVTNQGSFDQDEFAVIGEEMLDTRVGRVNTVKVHKVRAPGKKRETLMWFVPEMDYLLVKLVQVESDGSRYEINVEDAVITD